MRQFYGRLLVDVRWLSDTPMVRQMVDQVTGLAISAAHGRPVDRTSIVVRLVMPDFRKLPAGADRILEDLRVEVVRPHDGAIGGGSPSLVAIAPMKGPP